MRCPVCKNQIEIDTNHVKEIYYDCPHCSSSLFFKNGAVEVLNQEAISNLDSEKPISEEDLKFNESEALSRDLDPSSSEDFKEESSHITTQVPELSKEQILESEEKELNNNSELGEKQKPLTEDFVYQNREQESEELKPKVEESNIEKKPNLKEDFSEVVEFGNKERESQKGVLIYNLKIKEIYTPALRKKILDLLNNDFLNLSIGEKDIQAGELKILNISPVQVHIIVTALMGLPLHISWSQHHIAES